MPKDPPSAFGDDLPSNSPKVIYVPCYKTSPELLGIEESLRRIENLLAQLINEVRSSYLGG